MPLQGVSYVANEEGPFDFMFYCSLRRSIVYILREKVKQYTLRIRSLEEIGLLISKCQKYMLTNVHEYDDINRLTFHIM